MIHFFINLFSKYFPEALCKNILHFKKTLDNCRNFHVWQMYFLRQWGEISFDKSFNYKKKYQKLDQPLKIRYVWSLYLPPFPQKGFSTMETLEIINFLISKYTDNCHLKMLTHVLIFLSVAFYYQSISINTSHLCNKRATKLYLLYNSYIHILCLKVI